METGGCSSCYGGKNALEVATLAFAESLNTVRATEHAVREQVLSQVHDVYESYADGVAEEVNILA